ncbi:hypothetical protein [Piscirickettsia salmonis]|nr:hypothetical protein [Piscirickettsia salmonis]
MRIFVLRFAMLSRPPKGHRFPAQVITHVTQQELIDTIMFCSTT